MKRAVFVFLTLCIFLFIPSEVFAISPTILNRLEARVGEYTLSVSGYASKNASINIKTDNILMGSTTAQPEGSFSFSNLPIKKGFSSFCFETVDMARIGRSAACMNVPPATADIILTDIYLPPTIGLEKPSITEGGSGLTYGYTMPNASINIKMSNGSRLTTKSSQAGRYSYTVGNLPVGTYELSSRGTYQGNLSLEPNSGVTLKVLTSSAAFTNEAVGLRRALQNWLPWILLGILLSGLLGILLIKKYKPEWLLFITESKFYKALMRKLRRQLHHSWFVGY